MGHSSFTFFLCPFHCPSEGPALEGQLRGADGIGRLKSGVAVPSAARLWSIFPVTLHVSACLLCHVVILYIHLVFILHHVLLGAKPLLSGSSVWSPVSSGTLGRGTYSGNTVNGICHVSEFTCWRFPPFLSLVVFCPPAPRP